MFLHSPSLRPSFTVLLPRRCDGGRCEKSVSERPVISIMHITTVLPGLHAPYTRTMALYASIMGLFPPRQHRNKHSRASSPPTPTTTRLLSPAPQRVHQTSQGAAPPFLLTYSLPSSLSLSFPSQCPSLPSPCPSILYSRFAPCLNPFSAPFFDPFF